MPLGKENNSGIVFFFLLLFLMEFVINCRECSPNLFSSGLVNLRLTLYSKSSKSIFSESVFQRLVTIPKYCKCHSGPSSSIPSYSIVIFVFWAIHKTKYLTHSHNILSFERSPDRLRKPSHN